MAELKNSLFNRTTELFKNRQNLTIDKIAQDTGLDYSWLQMFARGRIKDPSVNRIQTLYEYLTQSQLDLR